MEFANLGLFKVAAEEENFTKAAKVLNCSQAHLSQVIKQMEAEIGAPLFDRVGRRVELNAYGKRLLQAAGISENAMENIRKEITALSRGRQSVRLVARCPMGDLPGVIKGFRDSEPGVDVVTITPGDEKITQGYDLELLASHREIDDDNAVLLCEDPYVLITSSDSFIAARKSISLKELQEVGFVASPLSTEQTRMQARLFEDAGFVPKMRCYSSSYWTLLNLVEQNIGVCIGCEKSWLVKTDLNVRAVPFSDIDLSRKLYLRWPKGSYLSDASLSFISYLENLFCEKEGGEQ